MLVIIIGMRTQNVGVYDNAVVHIRGGNVLKIKREKGKLDMVRPIIVYSPDRARKNSSR